MRAAPDPRQAARRLTAGLSLVAGCVLLFFGIAVRLLSEKLVLGILFRVLKGERSAAAARGVLGCARAARGLCAVPVHGKGFREHCKAQLSGARPCGRRLTISMASRKRTAEAAPLDDARPGTKRQMLATETLENFKEFLKARDAQYYYRNKCDSGLEELKERIEDHVRQTSRLNDIFFCVFCKQGIFDVRIENSKQATVEVKAGVAFECLDCSAVSCKVCLTRSFKQARNAISATAEDPTQDRGFTRPRVYLEESARRIESMSAVGFQHSCGCCRGTRMVAYEKERSNLCREAKGVTVDDAGVVSEPQPIYDWLYYQNCYPGWTVQGFASQALRQSVLDAALRVCSA